MGRKRPGRFVWLKGLLVKGYISEVKRPMRVQLEGSADRKAFWGGLEYV